MRHVISAVVQNVPGVLAHISGMLASRGYNIDSLAVGETEDPQLSRMTFVVAPGRRCSRTSGVLPTVSASVACDGVVMRKRNVAQGGGAL